MAGNRSFRKSQLIAFDNVAAGHDGVLSDPSGELVIKPCKQSEIDFYDSTSAHPTILPHIPNFLGKISLGTDTAKAQVAGALVLPSETSPDLPVGSGIGSTTVIANDWAPSKGDKIDTDLAVVLENLAHGFKHPNILDVKLGARLWADDAPPAKRKKLDKVSAETTSGSLGFRIAGMRTYQGANGNNDRVGQGGVTPEGYRVFDKTYGRNFTAHNIDEGFGDYFLLGKEERASGLIRKVIRRFIGDLKTIGEVFENLESRMYSASLLFVYEGDHQALQGAFTAETDLLHSLEDQKSGNGSVANGNGKVIREEVDDNLDDVTEDTNLPAIQSVKLIDFAHAEWTPGKGSDTNLLHGVKNVIKVLNDIV